ncbi:response regulator [Herbivorax sp. ANBcel31]|uniref:response regulator transcription factor n=1 Tax=Herbivorax sp. ANBcel31 TaxID=3069754 RepID=UPI0027B5EEBF|nr:response regulator [Herbivorax sp. ANBcel31]MDQ2084870.1 response regulator [Herbivorax sp. ANBcel31]
MLRVLIVDDEPLANEGLKNIIEWEKNGYEICGEASNGEEATLKIRKLKPDVVVTDVRMPVLDGLELISFVKNKIDSNIKFIILSGYSEFEYAKKAMEFGVKHYLLKPVFEEEITQVLKDLCTEIEREKENKLLKTEEAHMSISNLIKKLIHKDGSTDELCNIYNSTFGKNAAKVWYYAFLKILPADYLNNQESKKDKITEHMKSISEEAIENNNQLFVFNNNTNTFGLFIGILEDGENQDKIKNILKEIAAPIKKIFDSRYQISVGNPIKDLKEIKRAYNTSKKALEHCFYEDLDNIIFYTSLKNVNFDYDFLHSECVDLVIEAVEEINEEKVEDIIQKEFAYFKERLLDPEIIYMYVNNIIYRSNKVTEDMNEVDAFKINMSEFKNKKIPITQIKKVVIDWCKYCCKILREKNKKVFDENSYRIEKYIKENYKEPITIKEMSKNLYINPVYLGQLFKKIFGVRFSDYVHELRIDEAKRLLEETSMETCEIARELGYSNYNMFLKYFERNTGTRPNNYKKKQSSN